MEDVSAAKIAEEDAEDEIEGDIKAVAAAQPEPIQFKIKSAAQVIMEGLPIAKDAEIPEPGEDLSVTKNTQGGRRVCDRLVHC